MPDRCVRSRLALAARWLLVLEGAAKIPVLAPSFLPLVRKQRFREVACLPLGSLLAPGTGAFLWNVPPARDPSDPEGDSSRVYSKFVPVQSCS